FSESPQGRAGGKWFINGYPLSDHSCARIHTNYHLLGFSIYLNNRSIHSLSTP
ncbi:MAG: hypothetical protein ACI8V2_005218, partial [Candidatus Latescibacterota bacterium]